MRIIRDDEDLTTYLKTKGQPRSRNAWPLLINLWGGVCLNAAIVTALGTLTDRFLSLQSGSHEASSYYAAFSVLLMIGIVAIGYKLSSALVAHIDAREMPRLKRNLLKSILPVVYFAGAVVVAMGLVTAFQLSGKLLVRFLS